MFRSDAEEAGGFPGVEESFGGGVVLLGEGKGLAETFEENVHEFTDGEVDDPGLVGDVPGAGHGRVNMEQVKVFLNTNKPGTA